VEDWGKLLGDTAAVAALLDRLLHHAQVLAEQTTLAVGDTLADSARPVVHSFC
jgi:hypothetical protein